MLVGHFYLIIKIFQSNYLCVELFILLPVPFINHIEQIFHFDFFSPDVFKPEVFFPEAQKIDVYVSGVDKLKIF